jgi:hypothetical protein
MGDIYPDIRIVASEICNAMSTAYSLKIRITGDGSDAYRVTHWKFISQFLDNYRNPINSVDVVESLSEHRGIGPTTINVLLEILEEGRLSFLESLIAEIQSLLEAIEDNTPIFIAQLEELEEINSRYLERRPGWVERARIRRERNGTRIGTRLKPNSKLGSILSRYPCIAYNHDNIANSDSKSMEYLRENNTCVICCTEYKPECKIRMFHCCHTFHDECITEWITSRLSNGIQPGCPLCRKIF